MTQILAQRRALTWALVFAFWTLIGLSFASQFYLASAKAGVLVTWWQAMLWALGDWYVFALLSLPVIHLARRFRLEGAAWRQHALLHAVAGVLFSLAYMVLRAWVGQWQGGPDGRPVTFAEAFQPLLVKTWHFNLLIYWVIVCVSHAFDYYRRFQERKLRAAELERRLTESRLQALQMQLNPHFLFNTLHSISALMHQDVEAADRMIAQLSDLLRRTLDSTNTQTQPLREELAFLERYLAIEQTRFGERLRVEVNVPAELLDTPVPTLILQPLVENAIRHGIERSTKAGRIELRATRCAGGLVLEVSDNGPGLNGAAREGIGLTNTRARLRQLYGEGGGLELANRAEGGVMVRVRAAGP
jgi:two-component system, LytTR family, sensor kinase